MATGAVTAREPKVDTKPETTETAAQQPLTLSSGSYVCFMRFLKDVMNILGGATEHPSRPKDTRFFLALPHRSQSGFLVSSLLL